MEISTKSSAVVSQTKERQRIKLIRKNRKKNVSFSDVENAMCYYQRLDNNREGFPSKSLVYGKNNKFRKSRVCVAGFFDKEYLYIGISMSPINIFRKKKASEIAINRAIKRPIVKVPISEIENKQEFKVFREYVIKILSNYNMMKKYLTISKS